MATKNLIVHILWIIQMYEIPRAKPLIQNCLGHLCRERVGVTKTIYSILFEPDGDTTHQAHSYLMRIMSDDEGRYFNNSKI